MARRQQPAHHLAVEEASRVIDALVFLAAAVLLLAAAGYDAHRTARRHREEP